MLNVMHIVGARPNFMKAAPVISALSHSGKAGQTVVHTGQHYDDNMSGIFFRQLGIGAPDFNLGVGSGSHANQTAEVMMKFEPVLLDRRPDWVMVYGDVNSTVAAALVCSKLGVSVAHVEAGLRSFDRTMPEEINRIVTDQLSDLLFIHCEDAKTNLIREGVSSCKISFVGNTMIDTLERMLDAAGHVQSSHLVPERQPFALVTLHRSALVDHPGRLRDVLTALNAVADRMAVVFPMHPRTRARAREAGAGELLAKLTVMEPMGYLEFLALERRATVVITDSGGVQEETTHLGVPCLTVRENTERPVTVDLGTNTLVGFDMARLAQSVANVLDGKKVQGQRPPLWDGKAGERVAATLLRAKRPCGT